MYAPETSAPCIFMYPARLAFAFFRTSFQDLVHVRTRNQCALHLHVPGQIGFRLLQNLLPRPRPCTHPKPVRPASSCTRPDWLSPSSEPPSKTSSMYAPETSAPCIFMYPARLAFAFFRTSFP